MYIPATVFHIPSLTFAANHSHHAAAAAWWLFFMSFWSPKELRQPANRDVNARTGKSYYCT